MEHGMQKEDLPRGVARIWFERTNLGGPGGQHRNKSETDRIAHAVLSDPDLITYFGGTDVTAQSRSRSAGQNEKQARETLVEKIEEAREAIAQERKVAQRKAELPTRKEPKGAKERRIADKKRQGSKKASRQKPRDW